MFPLSDTKHLGGFAPVTFLLVVVNVAIFVLWEFLNPDIDSFIAQYALTPDKVNFADLNTLFPLITSQFLHGGWIHLIGNMAFLWVFGDNIEHRLGVFYLPFYLLAGVVGGLAQYFVDPTSIIPSLGASGAIAGILGAYLVLFPKNVINTAIIYGFLVEVRPIAATLLLGYWFFIQLFSGVAQVASTVASPTDVGGVAYLAHLGGFTIGFLVAQVFKDHPELQAA